MTLRFSAFVAVLLAGSAASAQTLKLEFAQGRVTLQADNVPVRTILAEWARLGGTRIVNGERVTGAPVTLELQGVPERQALDIVLRSVPGYMITARTAPAAGASAFDRIMILPTTTAPRPTTTTATFAPPPPVPVEDPDADFPDATRIGVAPGVRVVGPGVQTVAPDGQPRPGVVMTPTFVPAAAQQQQQQMPPLQQPPQPAPGIPPGAVRVPSNPFTTLPGSSRPGEVTPVPQQEPRPPANTPPNQ